MGSELLQDCLSNLFFVYEQLDTTGVLNTPFPSKDSFQENNVQELHYSFLKFLDANPELEGSHKTTLLANLQNGQYSDIYSLFHDLVIACTTQLLQNEEDDVEYTKINKFFKISTELLLREAIRLGVAINIDESKKSNTKQDNDTESKAEPALPKFERVTRTTRNQASHMEEEVSKDEETFKEIITSKSLLSSLEKDFDIITSSFYRSTGKSLSIFASGNIPFFTSLNNFKSDLDDREPAIDPALGVSVTNVIPNVTMENKDTLAKLTETNIKIPHLRQILENYMHPNWLRLISSPWLKHGSGVNSLNFSFAPTHDETQSIISNDWKGLTWCQQIGFKKLVDLKSKEIVHEVSEDAKMGSKKNNTENKSAEKMDVHKEGQFNIQIEDDKKSDKEEETIEDVEGYDLKSIGPVDIKNIINYDENKLISESEAKFVNSNKIQTSISELLIDLGQLRQERIAKQRDNVRYNKDNLGTGGRIFKPSPDEIKLYHKIRRLITGFIENKNIKPADLGIPVDARIPVLQHTYQGTLPAALTTNQKITKAKRRR